MGDRDWNETMAGRVVSDTNIGLQFSTELNKYYVYLKNHLLVYILLLRLFIRRECCTIVVSVYLKSGPTASNFKKLLRS